MQQKIDIEKRGMKFALTLKMSNMFYYYARYHTNTYRSQLFSPKNSSFKNKYCYILKFTCFKGGRLYVELRQKSQQLFKIFKTFIRVNTV
jgi:hypothetical protein